MHASSVETIADALNRAHVRYLIVGGLAVVAHGHLRFTADIDMVLDLEPSNVETAMRTLAAPVPCRVASTTAFGLKTELPATHT